MLKLFKLFIIYAFIFTGLQANDITTARRLSYDASMLYIDNKIGEAIPLYMESVAIREKLNALDNFYFVNYTLLLLAYYDLSNECSFILSKPLYKLKRARENNEAFKELYDKVIGNCLVDNLSYKVD